MATPHKRKPEPPRDNVAAVAVLLKKHGDKEAKEDLRHWPEHTDTRAILPIVRYHLDRLLKEKHIRIPMRARATMAEFVVQYGAYTRRNLKSAAPLSVKVDLRFDPGIWDGVLAMAKARRIPPNELVRGLVGAGVEEWERGQSN